MNYDYTLEIPGFFSKDAPLLSPLLGISYGSDRAGPGGTNAGHGRVKVDVVNVMRQADKASPHLSSYWSEGRHIPVVRITVSKAGEKGPVRYVYSLTDVVVTMYQMLNSTGGNKSPDESISFNCRVFEMKAA